MIATSNPDTKPETWKPGIILETSRIMAALITTEAAIVEAPKKGGGGGGQGMPGGMGGMGDMDF